MPFVKYQLQKKLPTDTCNGRMRSEDGIESYCSVPTVNERRCQAHNGSNVKKSKEQKTKQAEEASKTLQERTWWWMDEADIWSEKSKFLSVDRHLLLLAALIDEVGNRKPLASMTKEEVEHITKLIKGYAELSLARTETTLKLWDKVAEHWRGADLLEDYVWLLIREMGMAYNLELLGMQKETKPEKVQTQQTSQAVSTNGGSSTDNTEAVGARTT